MLSTFIHSYAFPNYILTFYEAHYAWILFNKFDCIAL